MIMKRSRGYELIKENLMIVLLNFNTGWNDHSQKNIQITNVRFHA